MLGVTADPREHVCITTIPLLCSMNAALSGSTMTWIGEQNQQTLKKESLKNAQKLNKTKSLDLVGHM